MLRAAHEHPFEDMIAKVKSGALDAFIIADYSQKIIPEAIREAMDRYYGDDDDGRRSPRLAAALEASRTAPPRAGEPSSARGAAGKGRGTRLEAVARRADEKSRIFGVLAARVEAAPGYDRCTHVNDEGDRCTFFTSKPSALVDHEECGCEHTFRRFVTGSSAIRRARGDSTGSDASGGSLRDRALEAMDTSAQVQAMDQARRLREDGALISDESLEEKNFRDGAEYELFGGLPVPNKGKIVAVVPAPPPGFAGWCQFKYRSPTADQQWFVACMFAIGEEDQAAKAR